MIHTGSLESDASRKIAKIEYDYNNNPVRIQFTNGNVTKYIYNATGEKKRVIYQTSVANIIVAIGSTKYLTSYQIQRTETVDYLLGGALTLKNGRIDKYQFDEGYCQASAAGSVDYFDSYYYDRDHLGNVRRVIEPYGTNKSYVIQTMDYYPFGAEFCDNSSKSYVQNHKYNGKEFDHM
ncbi:MAG: RHS repeat-associated core domain-containing protein, partial [Bacteroidaceae bacterium]|nr:RHS repeat-associated core domain-containing protein [Bacteroidaceae bacterium]